MNDNYCRVRRILWIILLINIAVAAVKIAVGSIIKSSSMTADGFHSLTDGSSNIIGLIGIRLASKPVDTDHPYGHGKFETLSGLFISGLLFLLSGNIIIEAVRKFISPITPDITMESLIVLLGTLLVNILVSILEYKKGKELDSSILISDSMHTRSDIFISLGVLITLGAIKLGLPSFVDAAASLVVAGFILHAGYEIFKINRDILVDKAAIDVDHIKSIAMSFDDVMDTHSIRSRGDKNALFIDMHIMTKPDLNIEQSHHLVHCIEDKIREDITQNAQVTAHIEPYEDSNAHIHTENHN
ncbi:MAG TPA: cation transporter [Clostridiales bacterium]|nr:cation transporter [Clostridiales bacterium]